MTESFTLSLYLFLFSVHYLCRFLTFVPWKRCVTVEGYVIIQRIVQ